MTTHNVRRDSTVPPLTPLGSVVVVLVDTKKGCMHEGVGASIDTYEMHAIPTHPLILLLVVTSLVMLVVVYVGLQCGW